MFLPSPLQPNPKSKVSEESRSSNFYELEVVLVLKGLKLSGSARWPLVEVKEGHTSEFFPLFKFYRFTFTSAKLLHIVIKWANQIFFTAEPGSLRLT